MDHRGTGLSTRLSCSDTAESYYGTEGVYFAQSETQACLDEIKADNNVKLSDYSATNAAYDLASIIDSLPDQEHHIYSVSYGTFLTNRFMELFPSKAESVIVDGMCQPMDADTPCGLDRFHFDMDLAVMRFLENQCDTSDCRAVLGSDPYQSALEVKQSITEGHCSVLFGNNAFAFGDLMAGITGMNDALLNIIHLPVFIGLTAKCDSDAIDKIVSVVNQLNSDQRRALRRMRSKLGLGERKRYDYARYLQSSSTALYNNIMVSEMWSGDYDDANLADEYNNLVGAGAFETAEALWDTYRTWDKYSVSSRALSTAANNRLHIINGDTDAATPVDQAREYYQKTSAKAGRTVTYNEFNSAGHGIVYGLTVHDETQFVNCGTVVVANLAAKGNLDDVDCLDKLIGDSLEFPSDSQGAAALETYYGVTSGNVLDVLEQVDSASSLIPAVAAMATAAFALLL